MTDVAPIHEIIEEIRAGRMVVLVDEEDRENEGDLVFAAEFVTPEPPEHLPYYGSWDDPTVIYGTSNGKRIKMRGDAIQSMFMPTPKDVKISALEKELCAVKAELEACRAK